MKMSRHERAIRNEIRRVETELEKTKKEQEYTASLIGSLMSELTTLDRLLNTAKDAPSKPTPEV